MRAILDTNVLVSALLTPDGVPARLLDAWFEGRYELSTSGLQLDELLTALPNVDVSEDPADNFLLAMAEAGGADYLATGDKRDVLALKRHGPTRIVTAKRLLQIVER